MGPNATENKVTRLAATWIIAGLVTAYPWLLGGQLLEIQLAAVTLALLALGASATGGIAELKVPGILLLLLGGYTLSQFLNPSFIQEWQPGLRIWKLTQLDYYAWLPSSIKSNFTDASPIRFIILILTAVSCALVLRKSGRDQTSRRILTLIATSAALIALVGLIQINLGSKSILGLFHAADEGLGLFFGTFLYKNHAASFFNLGTAISFACFFLYSSKKTNRRSNPSWLFLILAGVLFAGVVFSRSRFGFICSLLILSVFVPAVFKQIGKSGIPKKWVYVFLSATAVLVCAGGLWLLRSQGAKHLQTLNAQITEDFSFKQRKLAYKSELKMFAAKPIYGWGAGNYRHGFRQFQNMEAEKTEIRNLYMERHKLNYFWQHAHNDYLEWLIELGIIGTLILFSIPGYFFWLIFKSKRWKEPVPLMLLAGLGSTMIHALVDFPFQNPAILVTWFSVLAITANYCGEVKVRSYKSAY